VLHAQCSLVPHVQFWFQQNTNHFTTQRLELCVGWDMHLRINSEGFISQSILVMVLAFSMMMDGISITFMLIIDFRQLFVEQLVL